MKTINRHSLGMIGSLETVIREHVDFRARLEVLIIMRADDAYKSILLYATRERRAKADLC